MGIIRAATEAISGSLSDQWKEYYYCDAIPDYILVTRGRRVNGKRSANKGNVDIITAGSIMAVADGQCMIITDQNKVIDVCAEPGEFIYENSSQPSFFSGNLGSSIEKTCAIMWKRFTFGGDVPINQHVYYFNIKEIMGTEFSTIGSIPFRIVNDYAGIDFTVGLNCSGEYSYRICDPVLFYTNVCGNVRGCYFRSDLEWQLKTEFLSALQKAFAKLSEMGIRYSEIPKYPADILQTMKEALSEKWTELRGIELVSVGISSITVGPADELLMLRMQRNTLFLRTGRPIPDKQADTAGSYETQKSRVEAEITMAAKEVMLDGPDIAHIVDSNEPQPEFSPASEQPESGLTWKCPSCGAENNGRFCRKCGEKKPKGDFWKCPSCGTENNGRFCRECGTPSPSGKDK